MARPEGESSQGSSSMGTLVLAIGGGVLAVFMPTFLDSIGVYPYHFAMVPLWVYITAPAATMLVMILLLVLLSPNNIELTDSENFFLDSMGKKVPLPDLKDPATKYLTVVVPAYNEEDRLPVMIKETMEHLEKRQKKDKGFTYEVIVVNDGSKDKTSEIALDYVKQYGIENFRVLTFSQNRGKGGAVKHGMLHSRGEYLLMADADGATSFEDLDRLEKKLKRIAKDSMGVGVGSRAHLQSADAVVNRSALRKFLMHGFHLLVFIMAVRGIRDTQCGFKLFTREAARELWPGLHLERWAFDVELLYLAERMQIPLVEVPVNWEEIPGSKLSPFRASLQIGKDVILMRMSYFFGVFMTEQERREAASQNSNTG
eukprot:Clim_evm22s146 gene=Clim_evmTU22s146